MAYSDFETGLGRMLADQFDRDKRERQPMEEEWLKDQRQYQGEYEPDTLKNIRARPGSSEAFIRLTRTKVRTMDARIGDMVRGPGKKNWGIDPTPSPEFEGQTGDAKADYKAAEVAAEAMEREIEDQFVENKIDRLDHDVYHSGHKLGTGIVKGPLVQKIRRKRWEMRPAPLSTVQRFLGRRSTAMQAVVIESVTTRPYFEHVPVWDYYPEMAARNLSESQRHQHRHLMAKQEVLALAKREGFDAAAIAAHVTAHPQGDAAWLNWEQQLMQIGRYDPSTFTTNTTRNRYEVVEYWGVLDVRDLADAGVELPESVADGVVEASVWFFGSTGMVIFADLNPFSMGWRPFSFYTPDPEEERLFGMSVPYIMRDTQRLLNGAVRMWVDNAAFSAGPQVEIDAERIVGETKLEFLRPFRIWLTKSAAYNANTPAIRFNSFPNQGAQLMQMINVMKSLSDESTAIPSYQSGERASSGAGRTAQGLNMLMGAASLMIKEQMAAWDDYNDSKITKTYDWNMQFNPREDIKGDMKVRVIGAHSLALKADRAQQLETFAAGTANPLDAPYVKRRPLLVARAVAHELDPDEFVKTPQELEQETREMQQRAQEVSDQQGQEQEAQQLKAGIQGQLPPPGPAPAPASPPNGGGP